MRTLDTPPVENQEPIEYESAVLEQKLVAASKQVAIRLRQLFSCWSCINLTAEKLQQVVFVLQGWSDSPRVCLCHLEGTIRALEWVYISTHRRFFE